MKGKELSSLTNQEVKILNDLEFQSYAKKCVIGFIENNLKKRSLEELHNKGISQRFLINLLKEIDPENNLLKRSIKKGYKKEIIEMLNTKK